MKSEFTAIVKQTTKLLIRKRADQEKIAINMNKKISVIIAILALTGFVVWSIILSRQKSDELAKAFREAEESISTIPASTDLKTNKVYSKENQPKVDSLVSETNALIKYLNDFKNNLLLKSAKGEPLEIFLFEEKNAEKFKTELENYRHFIEHAFPNQAKDLSKKINTDDVIENGQTIKWEKFYFENTPLAGIYNELNKIKNDITVITKEISENLN